MPLTQETRDAYYEVANDAFNAIPALADIIKVRMGLWDKLAILDGGALALSLSAVSSFRGHMVGDGGIGFLFASWKLLIASTLLALCAQWFAVNSATFLYQNMLASRAHFKLQNIAAGLGDAVITATAGEHQSLQEKAAKGSESATRLERLAYGAGAIAWASTLIGFYWLYRFAHVNLAAR